MTPQETDLAKLPAKSWERSFLQAVIDYAAKHQEELIGRTQGKLKAEDQKQLQLRQKAAGKAGVQHGQHPTKK